MIHNILRQRLYEPNAWTVKVRFSSTGKVAEFAVSEVHDDGFVGHVIGRTQTGKGWVRYDALDYIRILEENDV